MGLADYIQIAAIPLAFAIALVGAVIGLIGSIWNGVKAITNKREDVRPFSDNHLNPLNVLYLPGRLTDRGKEARKKMLGYLALFMFSILIGVIGQLMTVTN